jgi:phenylacetic acid degradation operon negative regulatory protein
MLIKKTITLFAIFLFDSPTRQMLQTRLIVAALQDSNILESAIRMTLNRMIKRGLLLRQRNGRISSFSLSKEGQGLLARGRNRIFSDAPFGKQKDQWTLLNFSPSVPKNLRYQFEVRLQWGGFAALDNRLWIAPGSIDVMMLIGDLLPAKLLESLNIFQAKPTSVNKRQQLMTKTWDIARIRASHQNFIHTWEQASPNNRPVLSAFIHLVNDWTHLLRIDPGLPGTEIDPDWPAIHSEAIFKRLYQPWRQVAEEEFRAIEATIPAS